MLSQLNIVKNLFFIISIKSFVSKNKYKNIISNNIIYLNFIRLNNYHGTNYYIYYIYIGSNTNKYLYIYFLK
jgi:hypothetical protein